MCGTDSASVLNTPVRLVVITSSNASAGMCHIGTAGGEMPALATTMSSRPNCAVPSASSARIPSLSRTSTLPATMRLSSFSTSATVSAISSSVPSG